MKTFSHFLLIAPAVAITLVSCSKEFEQTENETPIAKSHIEFYANVSETDTKATLTPNEDDSYFASAWQDSDRICLAASSEDGDFDEEAPATWNGSAFEADFDTPKPEEKSKWQYTAVYPYSEDGAIPFASPRRQIGNEYNSAYDIMYGAVEYNSAYLGQDDNGDPFVVPMKRLTGIAYFHITSELDEEVVSATLTVDSGSIAAETITVIGSAEGASIRTENEVNQINLTLYNASSSDLQLWFNVLPGTYDGLTLEIETTNHKTVLRSNKSMTYTAGKLNKVVKSIAEVAWEDVSRAPKYVKITDMKDLEDGDYLIVCESQNVAFDGSLEKLDADNNYIQVTIKGNTIDFSEELKKSSFYISSCKDGGYNILSSSILKYISRKASSNGLDVTDDEQKNTISFKDDGDGDVNIAGSGDARLQLYNTTNTKRFRYYTTQQQPIQLYKLVDSRVPLKEPELRADGLRVEWDAINNADHYTVTITSTNKEDIYEGVNETCFDLAGNYSEDGYYGVFVVAEPSDTELYRSSIPGSIEIKIGTPVLAQPKLVEGSKTDHSITVNWEAIDEGVDRYVATIIDGLQYNDSQGLDNEATSVTFTGLEADTEYTITVQAISDDGKYVNSEASIKVTTLEEGVIVTVTDVLNSAFTGVTTNSYSQWTKTSDSGAVYAGYTATSSNAIQTNNNDKGYGIVTTKSGGRVTKISVDWDTTTTDDRTLNIYGKNSAYEDTKDLYSVEKQGDLLGTITKGKDTYLEISGNYSFIGLCSAKNAIYIKEIDIMWETTGSTTPGTGEGGDGGGTTDPDPDPDPDIDHDLQTVTCVMSDYFTSNTDLISTQTYDFGGFSFTFTKKNGSTSNYNASEKGIRFYKDDIWDIDAGTKKIVKIAFTLTDKNNGPFVSDDSGTYNPDTNTWTSKSADGASTLRLTASAQIRYKEFTITYFE